MMRRRSLFSALAIAAAALLAPSAPARAWTPTSDDALLFDARLGKYRLGDGVRGYRTPNGTCVDLADVVMALDLPIRLDKKLGRASGWAFDERRAIVIDRAQGRVQIANESSALSASTVFDAPEGWCVAVPALAEWLGVGLKVDSGNALLLVESNAKLPVELAAERKTRAASIRPSASFDLKTLPQADAPFKFWRPPSVDVVASIGGLRDRRSTSRVDARYEIFAAGEIGKASFDARLSSDRAGVPASLRLRAYRTSAEGGLLGPLDATHYAVGDVASLSTPLVAQRAIGRGAIVTNRPVGRPDSFDRTSFRGELPAGWDAELYRNGQLLAFANDRADGRYEFVDVPLLYGQNRFEVVLYGPQGQVRREEKTVPVGLDSIPARQTWYWAGINQANADLIGLGATHDRLARGWRGSFGAERGLDARTSVGAALHSLMIEGERRNYVEALVRRAIGPALAELTASVEGRGGAALRAQLLGQFGRTYLSAESIVAMGRYRSERVLERVTSQHLIALDHVLKFGRSIVPAHVEARYVTRAGGDDSLEAAARLSANFKGLSITGELDWRDERRRFGPDPPGRLEAGLLANARLGRVRLRGEARFRLSGDPGLKMATLVGEWAAGERADWRAELGYDRELSRARFGVGYSRRFDRFALNGSVEAASDGSVAAGLNLAFSFGPRGDGRGWRMSSAKLAAQGQAMARVYRDLNGDGVRQAGEPLEKDVQLAAGRVPVERLTDARGEVAIEGLEPFQPVLIGVDASSLADPLVQPAGPGVVVTPRPGVAIAIELPLSSAGEVHGTLVRAGGGGIEGVDLELIDVEGRVARVTRTDYDGYFLFEGVPYGRYGVRIARLSAKAARLDPLLAAAANVGGASPSANLGALSAQPVRLAGK